MDRLPSVTASAQAQPAHRWKVLGTGVAANAGFAAALSGMPTTAVAMRADYHLGNAELGLVLGAMGLGIALSELPWGLLTDRWGDRRVLLTGLGGTAVWLALMAFAAVPTPLSVPSAEGLAIALLIVGLLGGCVNGASGRAVMGWFREGERGLAMSIRQTALPAGGLLGALLLPPLATGYGFAFVYGMLSLLCAVPTMFAWYWLYEPPGIGTATPAPRSDRSAVTSVAVGPLDDTTVWRMALAIGFLCMPQVAVLTFAAVFLHDFSLAGVTAISACLAAVQLGAAVMRVWSGLWTDRRRNRQGYLRGCSLLCAVVFAALAVLVAFETRFSPKGGTATLAPIAVLVLGGICASAWHGVAFTELAARAGTRHTGTALALGNTFAFGSYFVVPLAIPLLLTQCSWAGVWLVGSLCALIAFPLFPRGNGRMVGEANPPS